MPENDTLCLDVSISTLPESILIDQARGDAKRVNAWAWCLVPGVGLGNLASAVDGAAGPGAGGA